MGLWIWMSIRGLSGSKVGTITPDKSRKWNCQACEMEDKCLNNKISAKEFEDWLIGCFKNRESHKNSKEE